MAGKDKKNQSQEKNTSEPIMVNVTFEKRVHEMITEIVKKEENDFDEVVNGLLKEGIQATQLLTKFALSSKSKRKELIKQIEKFYNPKNQENEKE